MARYFDVHPRDPQPRALTQLADLLANDGLIAYPTDSSYALGCLLGNTDGVARIRRIRGLSESQPLTLVCADMAQVGSLAVLDNRAFRAIRAATPGPYTFILPAARGVPRRLADPKRRSIGIRVPDTAFVRALLAQLGEPLVSSTLQLPGQEAPMTDGWSIKDELDAVLDAVVDTGEGGLDASTVVDWTSDEPTVLRVGVGDPSPFQ